MESIINVKPIDLTGLSKEEKAAALALSDAKTKMIKNQNDYELASNFLVKIKDNIRRLETMRKSITLPLDTAKRAVMDMFRAPVTYLENAESIVKSGIVKFIEEQERIRRDEERRLQAEADKKRIEALQKAEAARLVGNDSKAEKYQIKAESVPVPMLEPSIRQPEGLSYKELWYAEVINADIVPREYFIVNQPALDKIAQATKGTLTVSGVRFCSRKSVIQRGV